MTNVTKIYTDIPFAHRQWSHPGHCSQIHGHSWSFRMEFTDLSGKRDDTGFVIDLGELDFVKDLLDRWDHALLLADSDPITQEPWFFVFAANYAVVRFLPSVSCEGIAEYLSDTINQALAERFPERALRLMAIQVAEDNKNSAVTYKF